LPLTKEQKSAVLQTHRKHESDSGSSEIQVSLLTERIRRLTGHFDSHKKDHNSKRGLLRMVGRRRRLLKYLERSDITRYRALIEKLGLRG
jgi:small subunit ribosomal protein S15